MQKKELKKGFRTWKSGKQWISSGAVALTLFTTVAPSIAAFAEEGQSETE